MQKTLDWSVAVAIALLGGLSVVRAYLSISVLIYAIPIAALGAIGVVRMTKYRHRIPRVVSLYVGVWALLIVELLISSLWSMKGVGSKQEVILLLGMLASLLVAAVSLTPQAIRKLIPAFCIVGVAVAMFIFTRYAMIGSLRGYGDVLMSSYLVIARVLGLGTVATSLFLFTSRERPAYLWLAAPVLLVALALALARGALLSTLGILLLTGLFLATRMSVRRKTIWTWVSSRLKKAAIGFSVFGLIGVVVFVALQVERTARRLRRMISGQELEAGGRGALWFTSMENITKAPIFGYGLGSSGLMAGAHEGHYPHNLFLQVWLDGGVFAFLLLFALIAFPFLLALWYLIRRRLPANEWIVYLGLFLFLVLEYSKSIDFYSGRLLVVLSVVAVLGVWTAANRRDAWGHAARAETAASSAERRPPGTD
jgi:O-antigen ligase